MSGKTCSIHGEHRPVNLTVEDHHIVPRAWQGLWCPPGATVYAASLFDPRTVPLCPTSHRNVHFYIVAMMKWLAAHGMMATTTEATEAVKPRGHAAEFQTATLALTRWQEAGGSLKMLTDADQWGEA